MHLTKPTLLLLALTISASCVAATPHPGLLEGLWDGLGKTGQTIVSGLIEATMNGSAIAENFVDNLRNSTSSFLAQTTLTADQLASQLHEVVLATLKKFSVLVPDYINITEMILSRISSMVKRQALQDALAGLQGINAIIGDLNIALQNITDQLEEKKKQYALEIQFTWNNWAADQLKRVDQETNGTGVAEAQEVLNELENRYSSYLGSCLEEQQVRLAIYEQEVHTIVVRYQNATNDLFAQIEACQSKAGPNSCRIGIKKALSALQSAPRVLLDLKQKGLKLLAINLDEAGCVGQTLAEHALEVPSVERKLDEIIERNQQNASDSGSEEEASSASNSSSDEGASSESNPSSEEEASSASNSSSDEGASSESNPSSEEEASSESNLSSEEETTIVS